MPIGLLSKNPDRLVGGADIKVVREVFEAFAARDIERIIALADPAIVFTAVTGGVVGRAEPYRGHEGLREYFRDMAEVWDELVLKPREFRQVGDSVLVTGRVSARSPARVVSGSTGWVWRVRDGRVVYGHVYQSAADAVAAVEDRTD
jgi:ketosteroid isomerase-like protein